jgi:putative DNA primase/helicase
VLTGARAGVFAVDIDGEAGMRSFRALCEGRPPLPRTYTTRTPSGGFHLLFRQPPQVHVPTNKSRLAAGVDLRGDGGQVIGAGSTARTKDGSVGTYEAVDESEIANAPQWFLDACVATAQVVHPPQAYVEDSPEYTTLDGATQQAARAYVTSAVDGLRADLHRSASWAPEVTDDWGRGWEKLQADVALRLASLALSPWAPVGMDDARRVFVGAAPTDGTWTTRDVEKKWLSQVPRATPVPMPANLGHRGSVFDTDDTGPPPAPVPAAAPGWRTYSWTDMGNAERVRDLNQTVLRWVPDLSRWAGYGAGRWTTDLHLGERAAQEMSVRLVELESRLYDGETREKFVRWAKIQESQPRTRAAATSLRNSGWLDVSARDFDRLPMVLNVANGVIDLATGGLLPHDPAYLLRQQSPATYVADAPAPRWDAFLARVMPDAEMRDYLARVVGYSLTGLTHEQCFFMHHGVTKNGKSLFFHVVAALMGMYAQTVPPQTLLAKRWEQHPADVARMEGKRMLQLVETPLGARLDEALVKRLSGGDTVTARGMGQEFREFTMVGKVHLMTNHLPHINHDDATMQRLRLIEWPVYLLPQERDPMLGQRIITTELSGVLAWAVRGCLEWQRRGLDPPLPAQLDTETYIAEEDLLGEFIADRLVMTERSQVSNEHLWGTYKAWCELMNIRPMSQVTFGKEMRKRGFKAWRSNATRGWYAQIKLQSVMSGVS